MMARATRSSTADLKRKRSSDNVDDPEIDDHAPNKVARTESVPDDKPDDYHESKIQGHSILSVLEAEDKQGLLDRVFPLPHSDSQASLRSLLNTPTSVSTLKAAIHHLQPISSHRARPSQTAAQQLRFCNLALSLLEQIPQTADDLQTNDIFEPSSPQRPKPSYALVQHLPSGDWWTSAASLSDTLALQIGNAELVAILPSPSTSSDTSKHTLGAYSSKTTAKKYTPHQHRKVSTGAFLDYGPYSSFAPSFDQDGEMVGRHGLGMALWYREERKHLDQAIRRERREGKGSIVNVTADAPDAAQLDQQEIIPDEDLEALLAPEEVASIKAALNNLELEKSVQELLDRNQRALVRLGELQVQRLTKHPTSTAEEGSEEWDTAQSILDSLTLLASLRPRSSSEDAPTIIPPPSVLHKLHRTIAVEPSPGWYGTLPPTRATALRDDSTVKVRAGAATPSPAASTPVIATPTPGTSATIPNNFAYSYASQPQAYRPQAASYATYKPTQPGTYLQTYVPTGTQQSYYGGTANQQPYGAATGQQPYGYAWYGGGQYTAVAQSGTGSGRGTPQPILPQPTPVATSYGSFFTPATAAGGSATPVRTPAVANTVVATPTAAAAATSYGQSVPTLPAHLRPTPAVTTNGTTGGYQHQQSYFGAYQVQTQQPTR